MGMTGQGWMVLLSHHRDDQLHLCYHTSFFGRQIHFCARCSGIYPALFVVLFIERITGPWSWFLQWSLLFLAPTPALVEWGITVATARADRANLIRTLTGVGLGAGIGMNLAVNTRHLAAPAVTAQFVYFMAVVWLVWMISYVRRSKVRRRAMGTRTGKRLSLEEFISENSGNGMTGNLDDTGDHKSGSPPHIPQTR